MTWLLVDRSCPGANLYHTLLFYFLLLLFFNPLVLIGSAVLSCVEELKHRGKL